MDLDKFVKGKGNCFNCENSNVRISKEHGVAVAYCYEYGEIIINEELSEEGCLSFDSVANYGGEEELWK